jgi:PA14 domain
MKSIRLPVVLSVAAAGLLAMACQASFQIGGQTPVGGGDAAADAAPAVVTPATPVATPAPAPHVFASKYHRRRGGGAKDAGAPMDAGSGGDAAADPALPPTVTQATAFGTGTFEPESFVGAVYFLTPAALAGGVPDLSKVTPNGLLYTRDFAVTDRPFDTGFPGIGAQSENFAIRYEGPLNVGTDAVYNLRLVAADGAQVFVDDMKIIDNSGVRATPVEMKQGVRLYKGQHTLRVDYFQAAKSNVALQLFVSGGPLSTEQALRSTL